MTSLSCFLNEGPPPSFAVPGDSADSPGRCLPPLLAMGPSHRAHYNMRCLPLQEQVNQLEGAPDTEACLCKLTFAHLYMLGASHSVHRLR